MPKGRKNSGYIPQFNRGKNIPVRTHTVSIQQQLNEEKKKMLSVLSIEESLTGKIDELFNINLEGIPEGKEPIFSLRQFLALMMQVQPLQKLNNCLMLIVRRKAKQVYASYGPGLIPKDTGIL